jgi:hypothetical protein
LAPDSTPPGSVQPPTIPRVALMSAWVCAVALAVAAVAVIGVTWPLAAVTSSSPNAAAAA